MVIFKDDECMCPQVHAMLLENFNHIYTQTNHITNQ